MISDQIKIYGFSSVTIIQTFFEFLNPLASFILLVVTILYTYQKYKNEKLREK